MVKFLPPYFDILNIIKYINNELASSPFFMLVVYLKKLKEVWEEEKNKINIKLLL